MPVVAITLLLIWLLWSWAGARLIQGLIVGRANKQRIGDLQGLSIATYSIVLVALAFSGIYISGVIL